MFKSIFVKYISVFMLINILGFVLLGAIAASLISSYNYETKMESIKNAADSLSQFLEAEYMSGSKSRPKTDSAAAFSKYMEEMDSEIWKVVYLLSANVDEIFVFITDNSGVVNISGGYLKDTGRRSVLEEVAVFREDGLYRISDDIMNQIKEEGSITRNDDLDGFLNQKNMISAKTVFNIKGESDGAVFVCTSDMKINKILNALIRTVVMASLWIMLAVLVATYFITEKLVSPIRLMSRAAEAMAQGNFETRVDVRGQDEVALLAKSFNDMAESLSELEEMRRSFLANVSHDMRTPMTTIGGFVDGILDGTIPPEQHAHYLEIISSEIKRLSRLVITTLDITKMQAGERKFEMKPYDICEQARQILISFEQKIDAKQLEVEFDSSDDRIMVSADKDAIHQVIYNICDNGIKFSNQGGKYSVTIKKQDDEAIIKVYNEGIGIPEEDIKYIFDRFYKADKSRGLDKTGVGLGLYICKTIIEAHGKKIYAESEEGKWCCFTFTLPIAEENE